MPPQPTGIHALNTVFLHGDIGARPYPIEDVNAGLAKTESLGDITACGLFQMINAWMVTLKSPSAKQKLVDAGTIEAKGRPCFVIDPEKTW